MKYLFRDKKVVVLTVKLSIAMFLYVSFNIALAIVFGKLVDSAASGNISLLTKYFIASIFVVILSPILYYIYGISIKHFVYYISNKLRDDVFESFLRRDYVDFYDIDVSEKIARLTSDINLIESDYLSSIIVAVKSIILFIISAISILYISVYIGIFLLIVSLFSIYIPKFFDKDISIYKNNISKAQESYLSSSTQYLAGYSIIKSFNVVEKIVKLLENETKNIYKSNIKFSKELYKVQSVSTFFAGITFMGGFVFGTFLVSKNILSVGAMIACVQLSNNLSNPVVTFMENITQIKSMTKIFDNIIKIIDKDKEIYDKFREEKLYFESISLNNIKFKYSDNDRYILSDINISIEKNKKYAIVGKSGCGKSTLLKLIAGKVVQSSGEIKFNNVEMNRKFKESLYNYITTIDQEVFLFKTSLRNNISLYKNFSDEKIMSVLSICGLEHFYKYIDKEDFIGANTLSGGERQRISIARALINDTSIILADEIFSALDAGTAFMIEKQLLELENVSIVSVTHRIVPENMMKYDKIFVLNEGRIVEEGTYMELSNNSQVFRQILEFSGVK